MQLKSWGQHPKVKHKIYTFYKEQQLTTLLKENKEFITFGNGRSYGDSALNKHIIHTNNFKHFISFNEKKGILHCQSGVLISDIIKTFVSKGWFLKITPGTKLITIGGAIASDVHGKNHHTEGCFSTCVEELNIMLADGKTKKCSKNKNKELFHATCGGMGLTGIILDAKISLKKINSKFINQTTIKTNNLKETFDLFKKYATTEYSSAWIDCLAKDKEIGKSLFIMGKFSEDGDLSFKEQKNLNIPLNLPSFIVNHFSIKFFNWLYYNKNSNKISKKKSDIDSFFYPLDKVKNWNRIYGKKGFIQYQFILPESVGYAGIKEILTIVSKKQKASFLAVLKLYGETNENYLSFPMKGYSLAIDFKIDDSIFDFLNNLDEIVIKYNGRVYLTKDARVSKKIFEQGYSKIDLFRKFRIKNKMHIKFQSLQSKRLGL